MFPKFDAIPRGAQFLVGSEAMTKTGDFTFYSVETREMGERTIDPFTEDRIVYPVTHTAVKDTLTIEIGAKAVKTGEV
jgi:hypothetical protein